MAVILTSSQPSLSALKIGINSQDRKQLTETEKLILSTDHTKLKPTNIFPQQIKPFHSGSNVTFAEESELWFPDEAKYLYMTLRDHTQDDCKTILINFIQFLDLDFSIAELYQTCEEYHGTASNYN